MRFPRSPLPDLNFTDIAGPENPCETAHASALKSALTVKRMAKDHGDGINVGGEPRLTAFRFGFPQLASTSDNLHSYTQVVEPYKGFMTQ
jgi:hypothetical protein